ncbi:MAG: Ti-type conjugative transfer relaxase TraA [Proteobacteria bacterium]|nr:Ti-type conjugative transfer relaxase TraA [Pseudomonadota bacterium]
MAIYHLSMKPISRKQGRSSVAAAAYRSGTVLVNARDGLIHDYRRKAGVEHSEIVLPDGVQAEWAKDREWLWNAAEVAETRKDARVAREVEVALPHELDAAERLELTRAFARDLANRYGVAVDFSIHAPHDDSDVRNHHAHIMMTTRKVESAGLTDKTLLERENKWLLANDLPTSQMQMKDIRQAWEVHSNSALARAGHDIRIDHRSHRDRGLEIEPTQHVGVQATQLARRGVEVARTALPAGAARKNAELIRSDPAQVLALITNEKSVFDRQDIARVLHRYIPDSVEEFQSAFASVMASPALVELKADTGRDLAKYSTREMIGIEGDTADAAARLHAGSGYGVAEQHVRDAIARQDAALRRSTETDTAAKLERGEITADERERRVAAARLSDEQRAAIEHVTGREGIAAVVGFAGAGKSTMLAAAREAWQAQGFRVHGAALAGKAAEGLEESSGIESRTLASWELRWQQQTDQLGPGDILVVDEAGMIGSRQLARFVAEAEAGGAKIVLVGDHEQLQAINAGAPFRALVEQIGAAELSEVRRQKVDWQRQASVAFAKHQTADALDAYEQHGAIHYAAGNDEARASIVRDYLADRADRPNDTRVAMAHRRDDVRALNEAIRKDLQDAGQLAAGPWAGERSFQTNDGSRMFSAGDRVVFLENSSGLGVKNGMLGTVTALDEGQLIVAVDGKSKPVQVAMAEYKAIDHGYATTIHKNQGATVDRSFVLASRSMDRHLTYVALTRHRESAQLYAGREDFTDRRAGRLVDHGAAPYEHDPRNRRSYYATLETETGERRTVWGLDLERALKSAESRIGDRLALERTGGQAVTVDGAPAERNSWRVAGIDELARRQLYDRLGRDGSKESTLDYTRDFAQRRNLAAAEPAQAVVSRPTPSQERPMAEVRDTRTRRQARPADRSDGPSPQERRQLAPSARDREIAEAERRISEAAARRAAAEQQMQAIAAERDALDKKLSGYLRIDESDRVERDLARANLRLAGATDEFKATDQAHAQAVQARAALDPPAAKAAAPTTAAEKAPAKKPTAMELAAAKRMMEMTRQQSAKPSPTVSPNRSRDRDKDPGLKR